MKQDLYRLPIVLCVAVLLATVQTEVTVNLLMLLLAVVVAAVVAAVALHPPSLSNHHRLLPPQILDSICHSATSPTAFAQLHCSDVYCMYAVLLC